LRDVITKRKIYGNQVIIKDRLWKKHIINYIILYTPNKKIYKIQTTHEIKKLFTNKLIFYCQIRYDSYFFYFSKNKRKHTRILNK